MSILKPKNLKMVLYKHTQSYNGWGMTKYLLSRVYAILVWKPMLKHRLRAFRNKVLRIQCVDQKEVNYYDKKITRV
jgi:hypothetical protein